MYERQRLNRKSARSGRRNGGYRKHSQINAQRNGCSAEKARRRWWLQRMRKYGFCGPSWALHAARRFVLRINYDNNQPSALCADSSCGGCMNEEPTQISDRAPRKKEAPGSRVMRRAMLAGLHNSAPYRPDGSHQLYRHYDSANKLLYVGVSFSALYRLSQHKDLSHWFHQIATVKIENFKSREDVIIAEREAIARENPLHNIQRPQTFVQQQDANRFDQHTRNSRYELNRHFVAMKTLYAIGDIADELKVTRTTVERWWDSGELGFIEVPGHPNREGAVKIHRKSTGWQMIDFFEWLQQKKPVARMAA